jgi:hypothetical protein
LSAESRLLRRCLLYLGQIRQQRSIPRLDHQPTLQ